MNIKDKIEDKFRAHTQKATYGSAIDIRRIDYTSGYELAAAEYQGEIERLKGLLEVSVKASYQLGIQLASNPFALKSKYWADYCAQNNIS